MWYVVQVITGKENDIAGSLIEQGIKALVPKENRLLRSGGSWIQKEYILFTGYVFLEMQYNAENYYRVKNLQGVIRFLGDSRNPSTLSYLEAEWIMLLTGKDNTPIEPTVIKVNEDGGVKAIKGVLERFESRVVKIDKRNRKAIFEITVCGERKEVQLSIQLEDDREKMKEAMKEAANGAAQPLLEEAT